MARDYKHPSRRRRSRQPRVSWKLCFFTVLFLGLFVFLLVVLRQHGTVNAPTTTSAPPKVAAKKPAVEVPRPRFDFYTMLPKERGEVSHGGQNAAEQGRYTLQVASLKGHKPADRLKAQLALLGFDVSVNHVQLRGAPWTRVDVGPYASLAAAKGDQRRLARAHITSILRKRR